MRIGSLNPTHNAKTMQYTLASNVRWEQKPYFCNETSGVKVLKIGPKYVFPVGEI